VRGTFGFVATAGACAIAVGLGIITATVLGVDAFRSTQGPDRTPALYLLFGGTLTGVLLAAGTAWWLLGPIQSAYRRGGLAMVCGFATVLAMLVCIPIHQLFGRSGLLVLLAGCALASAVLGRGARRLRTGA
jgi:hypothetical protein